jgi:glycosyltransferase involved in cell wall biosynthesis
MANIRLLELRSTYKWGGGPDKTILLSAERHDRARVSVVVTYLRDVRDQEFHIAEKARARGFAFYEVPERRKFDLRAVRMIRDIILRHDINLIHAHDYKSDFLAYLVQRWVGRERIVLISTAHAWVILGPRGEFYRRLDLMLMKRFDHLIAVSHATKAEMVAAGVPAALISVIHNGIDTEAWSRAQVRGDLREEFGAKQAFPVIGYVGRIMPEKDLQTWLRAAAIVALRYPHSRFVLVGEGSDSSTQQQLQRLAGELGIAKMSIFPGYHDKLLPIYASFDIFMLSSRREGLPNSILEAMAMGLPVVTTDVAGAKELVVDGLTGFVCPQGDVEGLARALLRCVENEDVRMHLGIAGRKRVETEFSFAQRLRKVEDLYAALVKGSLNAPVVFPGQPPTSNPLDRKLQEDIPLSVK